VIIIEKYTNEEIRELVSKTYFMDRIDRMTLDLLNHYAFVLHENVSDITDEEIKLARNYAEKYLEKNDFWQEYNEDFKLIVNRQCFKAITNNDYETLEKLIYQVVKEINDMVNVDDWEFDIYYSVDYNNKLLLSRLNKDGYQEKINLIYDIDDKQFDSCDIPISNDMEKLGNINYNSYNFYELYDIKI